VSRPTYTNDDLAAEVGLVPQLINNDDVPLVGQTATEEIMKKRALLTEWKQREEAIATSEESEKEKEDKRRARESWLPSNNLAGQVDRGNLHTQHELERKGL
jgi:hypothetical protein